MSKPNLTGFLTALGNRIQDLEDAFFSLLEKRFIDDAEGVNLDVIGKIVGEPRKGREDELYRIFIKVRIRINKSSGTMEEIFEILHLIDRGPFKATEYYPAAFEILLDRKSPIYPTPSQFDQIVREAKLGGVGFGWHYYEVPSDKVFEFASGDVDEVSAHQGWSDDTGTTGGSWSDIW